LTGGCFLVKLAKEKNFKPHHHEKAHIHDR
jgi:hypothetical protein